MYRWYENSERCYSYLHDVHESAIPDDRDEKRFPESHGWPKWFSRGWTLQELVAPKVDHFFNKEWDPIGDKSSLSSALTKITRIPANILADGLSSKQPSVAQIISWAADRRTTREEDRAYSLLGLLGVHMPMLYGEGKNAFRRLQLEIIRKSNDHSIFAWGHTRTTGCSGSFLADDPSYFRDCSKVERMERKEFIASVRGDIPEELSDVPEERLRTFSVTNDGIQIWLPLIPCRRAVSVSEARLACRSYDSQPITIILAHFQSIYFRYFGHFKAPVHAIPQFQQTFLPYQDERCQREFIFELDVQMLSHEGFVQHVVFPDDVVLTDNSITLSGTNDCAVIVFEREEDNTRFALVEAPDTPGLMMNAIPGRTPIYELCVDSFTTPFILAGPGSNVKIGDYGRFRRDGTFERKGNISDLAAELDMDVTLDPVQHEVCQEYNDAEEGGKSIKVSSRNGTIVLRDATSWSLPHNADVTSLLKSLSPYLSDSHLVTIVVRCSECYHRQHTPPTIWADYAGEATREAQLPFPIPLYPRPVRRKLKTTTPLYTVMTPLSWCEEGVNEETWMWFNEIRHNFYVLVNVADGNRESASRSLMGLFGGRLFNDFIGNITFFEELPMIAGNLTSMEIDKGGNNAALDLQYQ
ncbi:hypothetical protein ID866_7772 [Astraeus odoratus]|nr:hypothetical protein ID866_7772 [Astraeus odoratus]